MLNKQVNKKTPVNLRWCLVIYDLFSFRAAVPFCWRLFYVAKQRMDAYCWWCKQAALLCLLGIFSLLSVALLRAARFCGGFKMPLNYGSLVKEAIALLDRFTEGRLCLDDFIEDAVKDLQVCKLRSCDSLLNRSVQMPHFLFVTEHGLTAEEVYTWCCLRLCWTPKVTGCSYWCFLWSE